MKKAVSILLMACIMAILVTSCEPEPEQKAIGEEYIRAYTELMGDDVSILSEMLEKIPDFESDIIDAEWDEPGENQENYKHYQYTWLSQSKTTSAEWRLLLDERSMEDSGKQKTSHGKYNPIIMTAKGTWFIDTDDEDKVKDIWKLEDPNDDKTVGTYIKVTEQVEKAKILGFLENHEAELNKLRTLCKEDPIGPEENKNSYMDLYFSVKGLWYGAEKKTIHVEANTESVMIEAEISKPWTLEIQYTITSTDPFTKEVESVKLNGIVIEDSPARETLIQQADTCLPILYDIGLYGGAEE